MSLPVDYSNLENDVPSGQTYVPSQTKIRLRRNSSTPIPNSEVDANLEIVRKKLNEIGTGNNNLKTIFGSTESAAQSASNAQDARVAAETAESNAVNAKNSAETARDTATTKASNASASAGTASSHAGTASTHATTATNAKNDAVSAKNDAVSAKSSAQGYATQASTSASTASTKATSASNSATNASSSASTASTKALETSTSAGNASSSAATASTSAGTASTHASNAASSASAASEHASTASTHANTASTHANTASTHASSASTHANTASGHASTASAKASEASQSASTASGHASAAQEAKSAMDLLFDNFDDRFLGAKTQNPTTDNDGNALSVGAVHYNTTEGQVRFWNGASWDSPSESASSSASMASTKANEASQSAAAAAQSLASAQALNYSDGDDGDDGKGWTGGEYDPSSGVVTFSSDDGLGFSTQDLRGSDATPAGSNTQIQLNADGTFGTDSHLKFAGNNLYTPGLMIGDGNVGGSEGGELAFVQAPNSTLAGGLVHFDSFANQLRFFEGAAPFKGAYIDLSQCAAGVGTNLLEGGEDGKTPNFSYNTSNKVLTITNYNAQ